MQETLYIAMGANLTSSRGGPKDTLCAALAALERQGAAILAVSPFYNTPAFPAGSGHDYVNAVAKIRTDWTPRQTLGRLHAIEAQMGRTRDVRWGQRTLDLDLIAAGDAVLPDPATHARWRDLPLEAQMAQAPEELILPHPRMHERAFVLVPMMDVAPDWVHPVLGRSVAQMCSALDEDARAEVVPLDQVT